MDISAALAATTATPANTAPSSPDAGIDRAEPFAQVMDRAREPSDSDEVREPTAKPADEASREAEKPGRDAKDARDARDDATPPTTLPFAMPAPAPINLELLEAFAEAANGLSAARDAQAPLESLLAQNAAMAAAQSAAPTISQPAPVQEPVPVRTVSLQAPVQSPAFTAEASEALRTFVAEGVQVAEIRVTPESLGPVEVRIEIKDSRADIVMAAAAPETRIALERSIAELKQSLASAGIQLGQASVNDRQPGRDQSAGGSRKAVGSIEESAPPGRPAATGNRLVDLWA